MKRLILIITLLLTLTLTSCKSNNQIDIITSSYFEYDIVRNITNDNLEIKSLIKPGTSNHDFEPSSRDIQKIYNSKLFVFTSYELHGWLNENEKNLVSKDTIVLNLSKYVKTELSDLHYWTDPLIFIELIDTILEQIIIIDPSNKELYINNALTYSNKIFNLHLEIEAFLKPISKPTIYLSGHNSMLYFENRYDIKIEALSNTDKPDADITSKQLKILIEEIKLNNITDFFTEELANLKIANTIKTELQRDGISLNLLELHGYHNISKKDFNNNVTYYDLLLRNFNNIKKALGN